MMFRYVAVFSTVTDCNTAQFVWSDDLNGNHNVIRTAGRQVMIKATMGDCPIAHKIQWITGPGSFGAAFYDYNGYTGIFSVAGPLYDSTAQIGKHTVLITAYFNNGNSTLLRSESKNVDIYIVE
jgi:hypothetical protein